MGFFVFAKVMMVVYNLLILVGGGGMIAVGFWLHLSGDVLGSSLLGVFSIYAVNIIKVDIFLISVGIIMVLLGFWGCCGAKKESKCLLIMFFSIIAIIVVSELTIGLFALAYSTNMGTYLRSWGSPALQDQYGKEYHFTNLWNTTMTKAQCCGLNNYTDFIGHPSSDVILHPSCCGNTTLICDLSNAQNSTVQGCFKWLEITLDNRLYILGAVTAAIGGTEIGAMFVSLYLFCYLDKDAS